MEPTQDPTPSPTPPPPTPTSSFAERSAAARPWYLQPKTAIRLGPVLIVLCVVLRFGWGGIEGPPFPFWGIAYAIGAAGIFLTYTGISERRER
jgi:hypothetical protein